MRLKKKKALVNFLAPCAAEIGLTRTNCALHIIFVIYFCLSMLGEILIFYSLSITELVSYSFFFNFSKDAGYGEKSLFSCDDDNDDPESKNIDDEVGFNEMENSFQMWNILFMSQSKRATRLFS